MPHKVGKKWKWGNIERSSKEDLRRTVYGIWMKNGEKGSFSKFWKTGKMNENDVDTAKPILSFRKVERADVPMLLDEIDIYCENERYDRKRFEKYLFSEKEIYRESNSMYYGLFADGMCMALSYLNKTPDGCVLVAEIQCVLHGYGHILLEDIFRRSPAVWLAADPYAGEKLLEYYRSFGLEEIVLDGSRFAEGGQQSFFLKAEGEIRTNILRMIQTFSALGPIQN